MKTYNLQATQQPLTPEQIAEGERRIAQHLLARGEQLPRELKESIERNFEQEVKDDTREIMETLTLKEQMMLAFVPLIISHCAWHYAELAMNTARDYRIEQLKKCARAVKKCKEEYIAMLRKDLDTRHLEHVFKETDRFIETCNKDFTIFYFSVNAQIKRQNANLMYDDLRTLAYISVLMIKALKAHNKRMNEIVTEKLGADKQSLTNPYMTALETLMQAYIGECKIDADENIKLCMKIFENNLNRIEFNLV
jgi:hypothetical protein